MTEEQLERELKAFAARWQNSPYDTPMQMVHAETMEQIDKENKYAHTNPNSKP